MNSAHSVTVLQPTRRIASFAPAASCSADATIPDPAPTDDKAFFSCAPVSAMPDRLSCT